MRITPAEVPAPRAAAAPAPARPAPSTPRFSVLNDFRYLTPSDHELLAVATGERVTRGDTPSSPFAQQLALDRRTGQLAPHQDVTAVYLRNAAGRIAEDNARRPGFANPYSGDALVRAVAYLEANGRGRADIRL